MTIGMQCDGSKVHHMPKKCVEGCWFHYSFNHGALEFLLEWF